MMSWGHVALTLSRSPEQSPGVTGLAGQVSEVRFFSLGIANPGTGKMRITGQLGEVMRESCEIAVSYVRTWAASYEVDKSVLRITTSISHSGWSDSEGWTIRWCNNLYGSSLTPYRNSSERRSGHDR